ncbi:MAG: protein phosphatase 2C domain-containing protein [Acidimicrobiales bacterium]
MTAFAWGSDSDIGAVRANNQDRCFTDGEMFAVADGMGGHNGGEIAAGLAVEALARREGVTTLDALVGLVHAANDTIIERGRSDPSLRGMGTTLCVLADVAASAATDPATGDDRVLGVANVGDSRLYVLDGEQLTQLTEDHSLVEALVRDGCISREEAARHPQRNIVTRALGIDDKVLVDAWELRVVSGDRYLLCSDGLFNELSSARIVQLLRTVDEPGAAATALVTAARDAGGHDNITAVVVDVFGDGSDPRDHRPGEAGEVVDDRVLVVRRAIPEIDDTHETRSSEATPDPGPPGPSPGVAGATEPATAPAARFTRRRLGLIVAAVLVVVVLVLTVASAYARSPYYVGGAGAEVVVFQGRPDGTLWIRPNVEEPVNLGLAELSPDDLELVRRGVRFDGLEQARAFGVELALRSRTG